MAFADSNRVRIAGQRETTFGVVPATFNAQVLRVTGADFSATKETAFSEEIRADRMRSSVIETAATSGGTMNIELSLGTSYIDLLEAALGGVWTTAVNVDSVSAAATTNKFAATGLGTNLSVGQWIYASGFTNAANNGWFQLTAVTANDITVAGTLVTETAAVGKKVKGRMLRNGSTAYSYSIEQGFTDIGQYQLLRGQRVSTFSLDVNSGSVVTGAFGFMGTQLTMANTPYGATYPAATTTDVVNATSNVGQIYEGGVAFTNALQSFNLSLDNALRNQNAVGSKFPKGIGYGSQTVSGSLVAYFEDAALYNKFLNHTYTSLSFAFEDGTSATANRLRVTVPKLMLNSSAPAASGIDSDATLNADWGAVLDPVTGCQIQIDVA